MKKLIAGKNINIRFMAVLTAIALFLTLAPPPAVAYAVEEAAKAKITSAKITSNDDYTYLTFAVSSKVQYTFDFTKKAVKIGFPEASSTPKTIDVGRNPIFKSCYLMRDS